MRRGTIVHYAMGSQRLRAVILTADRYNPAKSVVAPMRERDAPELAPVFLVPVGRRDWPRPAMIDLSRMRRMDPSAVMGEAGQLTEPTLASLGVAVRTYLGAYD